MKPLHPVKHAAIVGFALAAALAEAQTVGTAFTYQGELVDGGVPVDDVFCNFEFTLWDALTGGNQIGPTLRFTRLFQDQPAIEVHDGVFTAVLDFEVNAFDGNARWLQIQAECPAGVVPSFTLLSPRQEVRPVPYALALPAMRIEQNGPPPVPSDCPGDNFLRGPNVIGGFSGNRVAVGVQGATIAGGGGTRCNFGNVFEFPNAIEADFATVGGGRENTASGFESTVGGGNTNTASGSGSTVGGGFLNTASGFAGTVGGGNTNTASGFDSTVGGGICNTATGLRSTVPGGFVNLAGGDYSFAAGRQAKVRDNDEGTFVWADSTFADFVSTGPDQFLIRATGGVGIGTNAPGGALHVNTPTGAPPAGLDTENNGLVLGLDSHATYKWIQSYGGSLAINPRGNAVGIGTDSPGVTLDINGTMRAASCVCPSDARFKRNVKALTGALAKIGRLRGVNFDWKRDAFPQRKMSDQQQLGLIAQEVQAGVPEAVSQGSDGYYAVDYGRLTPVLIEAIKELDAQAKQKDAELCALRAKNDAQIAELREANEDLGARLARIEAAIARMTPPDSKTIR